MFNKPILAELIELAVNDCRDFGSGCVEDEEWDTGFMVRADWRETGDTMWPNIIEISIYENGVLKISYEDPVTKVAE